MQWGGHQPPRRRRDRDAPLHGDLCPSRTPAPWSEVHTVLRLRRSGIVLKPRHLPTRGGPERTFLGGACEPARCQNPAMTDVTTATVSLPTGGAIPQVGLGVWQPPAGEPARQAVLEALRVGNRHVAAARTSGVPREQVFVTTKLWNDDQGYDQTLRAFDASLQRLGLDYIDLYLLHWPVAGKRLDSWRALERLYEEKRARTLGVSNILEPRLL